MNAARTCARTLLDCAPLMTSASTFGKVSQSTHIGIFDSGIGGLSIVRSVRASMPQASLSYFADAAHAPYGECADAQILARAHRVGAHLIAQGVQLLVVACNTATAVAIDALRSCWPTLPIVGVEPGLKPAIRASQRRCIAVMATPATLRSDRFQRLLHAHAGNTVVHRVACPGLAALIEVSDLSQPLLLASLTEHCATIARLGADVVVMGCTHYSFVRDKIQQLLGADVMLIDTADAVSKQIARLAVALGPPAESAAPLRLMASGDPASLRHAANRWLAPSAQVEAWPKV
jgi:glutamate racemase